MTESEEISTLKASSKLRERGWEGGGRNYPAQSSCVWRLMSRKKAAPFLPHRWTFRLRKRRHLLLRKLPTLASSSPPPSRAFQDSSFIIFSTLSIAFPLVFRTLESERRYVMCQVKADNSLPRGNAPREIKTLWPETVEVGGSRETPTTVSDYFCLKKAKSGS